MSTQDRATQYARNGNVHLAYQVIGEGSRDVLFLSGGTTGDGLLLTFAGPSDAICCAADLRHELAGLGLEVRSGLHVGEVQRRGDDVGGVAVHLAARVMGYVEPCEVVVSGAVPPLMVGSGIEFDDRGTHELKGIPGSWQLLAAEI